MPSSSATGSRATPITSPRRAEDGDGALRCMNAAIKRAGISPAEIDYINAHGTSTPLGDEIELGAVQRLVGNAAGRMCMSSTKSSIGHLLGRGGRGRGDLLDPGHARRRRAADDQSRQPVGRDADRPRAASARKARHRRGAVEFVRIRRHECVAGISARRGLARPSARQRHTSVRIRHCLTASAFGSIHILGCGY